VIGICGCVCCVNRICGCADFVNGICGCAAWEHGKMIVQIL